MLNNRVSASSLLVFDRIFVGSHEERVLRVAPVGDEVEIVTDKGRFLVPEDAPVMLSRALVVAALSAERWDKTPAPATVATNAVAKARGVAALTEGVFADDPAWPWVALAYEQAADARVNVRRRAVRPRDGGAVGAARWWSEAGEDALANVGILG